MDIDLAMAGAKSAGKGGAVLPLAGVYELSGRPNTRKAGELSQATWNTVASKALVQRPKKQLDKMGHWVGGDEGSAAAEKQLALCAEEALLLVQQGLLLLRLPGAARVLSVAEAQALALGSQLCPLFFEVYAHVRDLGLIAQRLELVPPHYPEQTASASHGCGGRRACRQPHECDFRGRPVLALWSAGRASQKGWRRSCPDYVLATSLADDTLPSASEWAQLEALGARYGATVKVAVVDNTGSPVLLDCSSTTNPPAALSHTHVREDDGAEDLDVKPPDLLRR